MKKILIIVGILLSIIIGQAFHLFLSLQSAQKEFYESAHDWAIQHTPINLVEKVKVYNGIKEYQVIEGLDENNRELLVWHREDFFKIVDKNEIYSEENIQSKINRDFQVQKWIHIVPGIDDDQQFWEVVFIDSDNNLQYVYFDLYNGEQLRSYRLHNITSS